MNERRLGAVREVGKVKEHEVTIDELVGRASALVPVLQQRARQAESLRRLPAETVDDLVTSGFLRVATPARFGGSGHEFNDCFELSMELARGCGATAWCYSVWASHNWMVGQWPLTAQEEYFAGGPDVLCSSSFAPQGRLEPVDGGYRLSGRWGFSSGSDAATWALLAATAASSRVFVLVPRADYEVADTWFSSGLKGTGSNDVVVEDAFVPAHRVAPFSGGGDDPNGPIGWQVHRRASYRIPTFAILPWTLGAPVVGIAQAAVDDFVKRLLGAPGAGDSVAAQLRVAESAALVDAARLVLRQRAAEMVERGRRAEVVSPEDLTVLRRDFSFVARLAVRAVDILFEASGGHGLFESDPMQRHHRDVHAGSHHTMLKWDSAAESYGRQAFGLPPLFS